MAKKLHSKRALPFNFSIKSPKVIALCILLSVLTLGIYGQTLFHQFTNFDVPIYVTENSVVQAGLTWSGIQWAFTTFESAEWIPVTWLSLMWDYEFFGMDPGAFHLSNVFIHLISVSLLFLILLDLTGSFYRSAAVALLFAAHPLRVESVVWIAERKDVLSLLFLLLTLKSYELYVKNPKKYFYKMMLFFFALGLMSKPVLITLPFAFLLLDYWPFGRLKTRRDFLSLLQEKIPMILLAAASGILNYMAVDTAGGIASLESLPLSVRIPNALVGYLRYLKKTFWPVNLAHFYPYQQQYLTFFMAAIAVLILIALTAAALKMRKKNPAVLTGWLWFLGTLVPMMGFVQAGTQSIADRYTYIPHIGLLTALVWAASSGLDRFKISYYLRAVAFTAIMIPFIFLSWRQVRFWRSSMTLNQHAMDVTQGNYIAHENLAYALAKRKRYDEARQHYEKAHQIDPNRIRNLYNLGLLALKQTKYLEARDSFLKVLEARPENVEGLNGLGVVASKMNQPLEAIGYFMKALVVDPHYAPARKGLSYAYIQLNKPQEAQFHLAYLMKDPGEKDADVLILRGLLATLSDNYKEAIEVYEEILEQSPQNTEALFALGNASLNLQDYEAAAAYYRKALSINPNLANVHKNLAITLGKQKSYGKAEVHFRKALELKPNSARVYYRWGRMLARQNKWEEALPHYQKAFQLNPQIPGLKEAMEDLFLHLQEIPQT